MLKYERNVITSGKYLAFSLSWSCPIKPACYLNQQFRLHCTSKIQVLKIIYYNYQKGLIITGQIMFGITAVYNSSTWFTKVRRRRHWSHKIHACWTISSEMFVIVGNLDRKAHITEKDKLLVSIEDSTTTMTEDLCSWTTICRLVEGLASRLDIRISYLINMVHNTKSSWLLGYGRFRGWSIISPSIWELEGRLNICRNAFAKSHDSKHRL